MKRTPALFIAVLCALPLHAGPLDWFSSKLHRQVPAAFAETRIRSYLKAVLKNPRLKVSHGRGDLTGAERKRLDPKILERIGSAGDLVVADVAGPGTTGIALLASRGIDKPEWDPATDFLAYVVLTSSAVFPADADRALALCVHLVGEPALYGNAPEAGPIWLKKDPGGPGRGGDGGPGGGGPGGGGRGGRGSRFSGSDSFAGDTSDGYEPRPGEVSPDADDIPAWVTRGAADAVLGEHLKRMRLGLLIALARGPGGHGVQITHATGTGSAGKPIFGDLNAPEVRPLRRQR